MADLVKVAPDKKTLISQCAIDFSTDFTSATAWTTTDSTAPGYMRVDAVTDDQLEWEAIRDGTNDNLVLDMNDGSVLGADISNTQWSVRFKLVISVINGGNANTKHLFMALTTGNQTVSANQAQDNMTFNLAYKDVFEEMRTGHGTANVFSNQIVFTRAFFVETLFIEMKRLTATTGEVAVSSTSSYTEDLETVAMNPASTEDNFRYIKWCNHNASTQTGDISGSADDLEIYDGCNP